MKKLIGDDGGVAAGPRVWEGDGNGGVMCTLVLAHRVWSDLPLLVAGNRDEALARPAAPPRIWRQRPYPVLAPVDEQAGGTWLGIHAGGLFAGVTNRAGTRPADRARPSRGQLVLRALEESNAERAAERVVGLDLSRFNRFHLLLADRERAWLIWADEGRVEHGPLSPGVHVLTERSLGAVSPPQREIALRAELGALLGPTPPGVERIRALLSRHAEDPFDGPCVHAPHFQYGTRSWFVCRAGERSGDLGFLHAEGPPCLAAARDHAAELAQLGEGAAFREGA